MLKRPDWGDGAKPFSSVERLSHVFADILTRFVLPAGGVTWSCAPSAIAVTGHSLSSANEILKVYMLRDSRVTMNAQRKRGLVA